MSASAYLSLWESIRDELGKQAAPIWRDLKDLKSPGLRDKILARSARSTIGRHQHACWYCRAIKFAMDNDLDPFMNDEDLSSLYTEQGPTETFFRLKEVV